jgi:hypothetical protein
MVGSCWRRRLGTAHERTIPAMNSRCAREVSRGFRVIFTRVFTREQYPANEQ